MIKNLIVIDTNVFISSNIGQNSFPRKIFEDIIIPNEVKICLSDAVFSEYKNVMKREKFSKIVGFKTRADLLLLHLKKISLFFEPVEIIDAIDDEPDNRFLELAIEAKAKYLVTGNTNDFTMKIFRGVEILTPKEFYEKWASDQL